jgi:hypothetical protein
MLKKFLVVAVAAAAALVLLPTVTASADSILPKSRISYCYGIQKKGAHNEVLVTVEGKNSKAGNVAGLGTLAIANTSQCKNTGNGVPIVGLTIFSTVLKNSSGSVLARGPQIGTKHKSVIGSATTHRKVACRAQLRVFMKISYSYSDNSFTRPFWVHTRVFKHC